MKRETGDFFSELLEMPELETIGRIIGEQKNVVLLEKFFTRMFWQ